MYRFICFFIYVYRFLYNYNIYIINYNICLYVYLIINNLCNDYDDQITVKLAQQE